MVTRLALIIVVMMQAQRAANSPLRFKRSPRDVATQPIFYSSYQNSGTRSIPTHSVSVLPRHIIIKNNPPHLIAPIPLSQFYYHSKLHVIPRQNIIQQHIGSHENIKIPVISHHSVSHTSPNANTTHSTSVIPVFVHHHLIPLNDLSVIPLQRHHKEKLTHYRAMEKSDDEEPSNQYRTFYGGHGNGLFFGGQGAGHGFYAYGK